MAVNMAVGVHYAAGVNIPVHRNLVLLKPKATPMATLALNNPNPNPASNYGPLQLPTATATPTKGKTIVAATSSNAPSATTGKTTIQFVNSTGSQLALKGHKFWLGNKDGKDIPDPIDATADYTHSVDDSGSSVGGVLYLLDGLVYWVVAWRNTAGSSNNKVYTNIITSDDPSVLSSQDKFWDGIYKNLQKSSSSSKKDDPDLGYSAHLNTTSGNTPTVSASFSNYGG